MFGYVKPYVPTLTVAQHEAYKAIYCGLCREMGKVTGQSSRLFLSYDFAFLAVFRLALEKVPCEFESRTCVAHPTSKRTHAKSNSVLTYCAYAAAILNDGKIKDDLMDERGYRKLRARVASPMTSHYAARCDAEYDALKKTVNASLVKLGETESREEASIDTPADCFAALLADVASFGLSGDEKLIADGVGRSLGKLIYVLDAADDLWDDIKSEKYNPLALVYGKDIFDAAGEKKKPLIKKAVADEIYTAVCLECERMRQALDLADLSSSDTLRGIIYNVACVGIKSLARHILYGTGENENPLGHRF